MSDVPKCDRCGWIPRGKEDGWVTIDLVKWRTVGGNGSITERGGLLKNKQKKNTWHEVDLCPSCVEKVQRLLLGWPIEEVM